MSLHTVANATPEISIDISKASILTTFIFGAIMIFAVGFLPTATAHNATHDTRHNTGFPCH